MNVSDLTSQSPTPGPPVEALLQRMRDGDRQAAAEFITCYEGQLRRRIRGKLSQPMRRIFDSEEIFSTVLRRLDRYISQGRFRGLSKEELWSLVYRLTDNAVVDKVRIYKRVESAESSEERRALTREAEAAPKGDIEIERAFKSLRSPLDRRIVEMMLDGNDSPSIARETDLTPTAVRKRWESIRGRLRSLVLQGLL